MVRDKKLSYEGATLLVPGVEASVCSVCEERVVLPEQARRNDRRYADARRAHDGLLTSEEIEGWRTRFGLTQQQAAQLLGGGANAFSKYERGEVTQSRSMDLLIRASSEIEEVRVFLGQRASLAFGPPQVWETVKEVDVAPARSTPKKRESAEVVLLKVKKALSSAQATNDGKWHVDDGEAELRLKYG
ncbi:hypothetical protein GCM10025759_18830 [Lysobacter panacisoli]|uniref:HTH cro/C1-type domain-containing protein n=1 Tax=Lysobacter panacisoli TaxID=1255263 RepID=A0ABP9LC04_9GAMM